MNAKILGITEKETFNGVEYGFILDEVEEDGSKRVFFPFFRNLVSPANIGKIFVRETENGTTTEYVKSH